MEDTWKAGQQCLIALTDYIASNDQVWKFCGHEFSLQLSLLSFTLLGSILFLHFTHTTNTLYGVYALWTGALRVNHIFAPQIFVLLFVLLFSCHQFFSR